MSSLIFRSRSTSGRDEPTTSWRGGSPGRGRRAFVKVSGFSGRNMTVTTRTAAAMVVVCLVFVLLGGGQRVEGLSVRNSQKIGAPFHNPKPSGNLAGVCVSKFAFQNSLNFMWRKLPQPFLIKSPQGKV